jgi:hypothetical protein
VEGELGAAQIRADADVHTATITGTDHVQAAGIMATAEVTAAGIRSTADLQAAQIGVSYQTAVAQIRAGADVSTAQVAASSQVTAAEVSASYEIQVAEIEVSNQVQIAEIGASYQVAVATIKANADVEGAQLSATASKYGSDQSLAGSEYSAEQGLQGTEVSDAGQTQRLEIKLAWADSKWNMIWPYVQVGFGSSSGLGASADRWQTMLGAVGPQPSLIPTSVYTEQQVQQQCNIAWSKVWLDVQSKNRTAQIDLAGRGFSSASPILETIQMGIDGQGIIDCAEQDVKIRVGADVTNAQAVLKSQTAIAASYQAYLAAYTGLEKNLVSLSVGMVSATASLAGAGG